MEFVKSNIDELIFEKRNKAYGAYFLRRIYNRNVNIAMVITLAAFLLLMSIPVLQKLFTSEVDVVKPVQTVDVTALAAPPPLDEMTPPPPPPDLPPPPPKTIKFTPPVVKPDEEVPPEEEPPTQEELKEAPVASSTTVNPDAEVNFNDAPVNVPVEAAPQKPLMFVEQMPQFPGGEEALIRYLSDKIRYPAAAREAGTEGTVMLEFVVGTDGAISDIKALRKVGGGCTEEAIRVVSNMPKWAPGKQNSVAVPVMYRLPVIFRLQSE